MQCKDFFKAQLANSNAKNLIQSLSQDQKAILVQALSNKRIPIKVDKSLLSEHQKLEFKKVRAEIQFLGYDKENSIIIGVYGHKIQRHNLDKLTAVIDGMILSQCWGDKSVPIQQKIQTSITFVFFSKIQNQQFSLTKLISNIWNPLDCISAEEFTNDVIRNMPLKYLQKVNNVAIVFPNFLDRTWHFFKSFGIKNQFYNNYLTFFSQIDELNQFLGKCLQNSHPGVLQYDTEIKRRSALTFSQQKIVEPKLPNLKQTTSQQNMSEKLKVHTKNIVQKLTVNKKRIWLDQKIYRFYYKHKLEDYIGKQIPLILEILINEIQQNNLSKQNIFRKSPAQQDLIKFQSFINSFSQIKDIHKIQSQIKQNLKKFRFQVFTGFIVELFMHLKHPIISFQLCQKFLAISERQLKKIMLKSIQKQQIILYDQGSIDQQKFKNCTSFDRKCSKIQKRIVLQNLMVYANKNHQTHFYLKPSNQDLMQFNIPNLNQNSLQRQRLTQMTSFDNKKSKILRNQQESLINTASFGQLIGGNTIYRYFQIFKYQDVKSASAYKTFKSVIRLLNMISSKSMENKMTSQNLAICLTPCFFRVNDKIFKDQHQSLKFELGNNRKFVKILQLVIQHPAYFMP